MDVMLVDVFGVLLIYFGLKIIISGKVNVEVGQTAITKTPIFINPKFA